MTGLPCSSPPNRHVMFQRLLSSRLILPCYTCVLASGTCSHVALPIELARVEIEACNDLKDQGTPV